MVKSDQEEMFGRKKGEWVWCLHCEKVYQVGEFRLEKDDLQMCPYPGCDGDTVTDSWPWKAIRENHPEYPEIPERDKKYPLYS
jgi:hypothetical protein